MINILMPILMFVIIFVVFYIVHYFLFAYADRNIKNGTYIGKVIDKREYCTYRFGKAIVLTVDFGEFTKIFSNASWTLKKYNKGNKVKWEKVFWLKDPRGIENLTRYKGIK